MLRTSRLPPLPSRGVTSRFDRQVLTRRRGPRYRGPWRLPGPDFHRLADTELVARLHHHHPSRMWLTPELLGALRRSGFGGPPKVVGYAGRRCLVKTRTALMLKVRTQSSDRGRTGV